MQSGLTRTGRIGLAALAVVTLATGCAGGDAAAGCTTNLTFTDLASNAQVVLTHGAAVSFLDGAAYTAFASDQPVDASEITLTTAPTPGEGATLASLFVTRFNASAEQVAPIPVGTVVSPSGGDGELVFGVVVQRKNVNMGNSMDASGTLTVNQIGDSLCFDIDYKDTEKQMVGTFQSPSVALI